MRKSANPTVRVFAKRGLFERFQCALSKLGWERKGETIVIGVSGGRDSIVLLHLFLCQGHKIIVAHLNHGLRGKESDGDEAFVRQLAKSYGLPFVSESENVRAQAKRHKLSLEEAARIARYNFLYRVARAKKIARVAVAHHQRDQAETVLLKIFQGADRATLRGMPMVRPLLRFDNKGQAIPSKGSRIELFRPLLEAPLDELALYVRQNDLRFRVDSSNGNLAYPRNWVRQRLLPLIEKKLNRNVVKTLARLAADEPTSNRRSPSSERK